jgi:protein-tyrosine phosphatase
MNLNPAAFEKLLPAARDAILATQSASPAMLQRVLKLDWDSADELMRRFEGDLVSAPDPHGRRMILPRLLDLTHGARPHNSYWVVPGSLMAGEYPGDRDDRITRRKLADYLRHGLDAFLDLTEAHELAPYESRLYEVAAELEVDCAYRRMAILDVDVPDQPGQMRAILDQIGEWRRQGRSVYVHCWGGVGRTGTVVGCHLVDDGLDGQAALDHLRLLWTRMSDDKRRRKPESPETGAQRDYVLNWNDMAQCLAAQDETDAPR